jgi:hypothetical protein
VDFGALGPPPGVSVAVDVVNVLTLRGREDEFKIAMRITIAGLQHAAILVASSRPGVRIDVHDAVLDPVVDVACAVPNIVKSGLMEEKRLLATETHAM